MNALRRRSGSTASTADLVGHIPTGWWPSSVRVSADGRSLVRRQRPRPRRRAQPRGESRSPKFSVLGTVNIIPTPSERQLDAVHRARVCQQRLRRRSTTMTTTTASGSDVARTTATRSRARPGRRARQIKHVIFINKENATHDLLLGDITQTRKGVPVNGQPAFSLGHRREPEPPRAGAALRLQRQLLPRAVGVLGRPPLADRTIHHRIRRDALAGLVRRQAQRFGRRSGGHQELSRDASGSPTPTPRRSRTTTTSTAASILHLDRHGRSFVNFGNGFEFAVIDEPGGAEPTGAREHANVPMEKVVRDNSDHLFPTFNTAHPRRAAARRSDRGSTASAASSRSSSPASSTAHRDVCKLPQYVDLLLSERPRRRRTRHQPERARLVVQAVRAGQRCGARPDRRARSPTARAGRTP